MKAMKFKNKKAAAFGCYGWSGESAKMLRDMLEGAGFEMVAEEHRAMWTPDPEAEEKALEYGKEFAKTIR
jgi:flavorubredoxin